MKEGNTKPDVTRTRSRCTSLIGAVLSRPPPKGIEGWSLADCLINRPANLTTWFFPSLRVPLTISQSHRSITWKSGTDSSPERTTWPYWACQFSSSQEVPGEETSLKYNSKTATEGAFYYRSSRVYSYGKQTKYSHQENNFNSKKKAVKVLNPYPCRPDEES